jgi:hypothetical protein
MVSSFLFLFYFQILFAAVSLSVLLSLPNTNFKNISPYMHCPYHSYPGGTFNCFGSPKRVLNILSYQTSPKFNFHDIKVANRLRNKSLLLIGDSLMRNQYASLGCFLWEYDPSAYVTNGGNLFQIHSPQLNLTVVFSQSYLLFNSSSAKEIYKK